MQVATGPGVVVAEKVAVAGLYRPATHEGVGGNRESATAGTGCSGFLLEEADIVADVRDDLFIAAYNGDDAVDGAWDVDALVPERRHLAVHVLLVLWVFQTDKRYQLVDHVQHSHFLLVEREHALLRTLVDLLHHVEDALVLLLATCNIAVFVARRHTHLFQRRRRTPRLSRIIRQRMQLQSVDFQQPLLH